MIMKSGGVMCEWEEMMGWNEKERREGHRRDVRSATFAPRHNNASQIIMDVW